MHLDAKLAEIATRSAKAYLQRQQLEQQRQQIGHAIVQVEHELLRLDGEERALRALKQEALGGQ